MLELLIVLYFASEELHFFYEVERIVAIKRFFSCFFANVEELNFVLEHFQ